MKPYLRFRIDPPRKYPASRFRFIQPKIGYLYRADGKILAHVYALADPACRDGAMLRIPPDSFADVYYAKMLPCIRNDAEQEAAAVYFDPYAGQFVVVGSGQLYHDAKAQIGTAGTPVFLENETPFSFDPMTYGTYEDPDDPAADMLTYDDYFTPDVTGVSIADCMLLPQWDGRQAPWRCAVSFFNRYFDRLHADCVGNPTSPDVLTTLLARIVANRNHELLSRLFVLIPQLTARFRPTLQEEQKFVGITVPGTENAPRIFNLFQYTLLCGDADVIEGLFRFYERPGELAEFMRHPLYYSVGFFHIRAGNTAALSVYLSKNGYAEATDAANGRMSLLSYACVCRRPGMAAMLLSAGADPKKRDSRGNSPLDYAARANDCTALSLLLSALPQRDAENEAAVLAEALPLSDENQALLGVLKTYL